MTVDSRFGTVSVLCLKRENLLNPVPGALHTLFRIFDACGEQLSSPAWQMCYRVIVIEMLSADKANFEAIKGSELYHESDEIQAGWNETAVIIFGGVSRLLTQNLDTMISSANFTDMWNQLLGYVRRFWREKC